MTESHTLPEPVYEYTFAFTDPEVSPVTTFERLRRLLDGTLTYDFTKRGSSLDGKHYAADGSMRLFFDVTALELDAILSERRIRNFNSVFVSNFMDASRSPKIELLHVDGKTPIMPPLSGQTS